LTEDEVAMGRDFEAIEALTGLFAVGLVDASESGFWGRRN
jgi:hypothetical protein